MIMNVEMHFSLKHFLHLATLFYVVSVEAWGQHIQITRSSPPSSIKSLSQLAGSRQLSRPPPQHHSYPPYPTELHTFINNSHITSSADKQRLYKGMANLYTIILIFAKGSSPLIIIKLEEGQQRWVAGGVFYLKKHLQI